MTLQKLIIAVPYKKIRNAALLLLSIFQVLLPEIAHFLN